MHIRLSYGSDEMFILITYDVNTEDSAGRKRLRRIAKICVNYGIRVQNSVFECQADAAQWRVLKAKLLSEIDSEKDSLRFYFLNDSQRAKAEHHGAKETLSVDQPLIL
jgi:CRISPR-associated protein Cas2